MVESSCPVLGISVAITDKVSVHGIHSSIPAPWLIAHSSVVGVCACMLVHMRACCFHVLNTLHLCQFCWNARVYFFFFFYIHMIANFLLRLPVYNTGVDCYCNRVHSHFPLHADNLQSACLLKYLYIHVKMCVCHGYFLMCFDIIFIYPRNNRIFLLHVFIQALVVFVFLLLN